MAVREKRDIYQMVTDRIIEELEKGRIPWQKPWTGIRSGAYSRVTKKPYSLLNQIMLAKPGEYATYEQWKKLGGQVRGGEKSSFVVFWKMYLKKTEKKDEKGETIYESVPVLRYYNVFHIDQVDGVEPLEKPELQENEPIAKAEEIIADYVVRSGIEFSSEQSNRAFYSPLMDKVVVPLIGQFPLVEEYYSTTFHELTHSTGHADRLNRFTEEEKAHRFGDENYSKEELVAEIGAATIMNTLGFETEKSFRNSAAYIQSWVGALKNDKRFIVSASGKAAKAVDLILGNLPETVEETHKESEE